MEKNRLVHDNYLPGTLAARERLFSSIGNTVAGGELSAQELALFLVVFSSLGVQMTEPVEHWIRRAGERSEAVGFAALGRALKMHAKHEANHHLMMIDDAKLLTERYNQKYGTALDVEALLASAATPGVVDYVKLHEDVIASDAPFCQIAIEYEIENLSVSLGPKLLAECVRKLGNEVLDGLSFLREHVEIDGGHTAFNEVELQRVLAIDPQLAEKLSSTGSAALDAYARFLGDCLSRARALLTSTNSSVALAE